MSVIYDIDFETGDFSELTADSTGGAQLYVSSTDAINGTYSANHDWSASAQAVSNSTSIGTPFVAFRVGFRIKIKASFGFGSSTGVGIFNFLNGAIEYSIQIAPSGGNVVARIQQNGATILTGTTNLDDGTAHTVEFRAVRESAPVAGDGIHGLYVDGFLEVENTAAFNESEFSAIRIGFQNWQWKQLQGADGTGGIITDDWILRDDDMQIYPPSTPATDEFAAALIARRCDIDMDGSFIYIGALNSLGQPTLIKFSTALNADGSVVFSPGGGDSIGVEVGKKDADVIWVAGNFGGTDTVEKSEDAGTSFTVKDDGTFDPVTSFAVGPDSDERVLIFADAGGSVASTSIYETIDDGASWETKNSGLGLVSRAVERLDVNIQELISGNEAAATNNIDYSPNSGEDLEDYSSGFPEADVTKLIVG